jgi:hypothetical protein
LESVKAGIIIITCSLGTTRRQSGQLPANITTAFINFFAYFRWAYDLKQPSKVLVQRVVQKLGDGSHTEWGHVKEVPEEEESRLIAKQNIEELLLEAEERAKGI